MLSHVHFTRSGDQRVKRPERHVGIRGLCLLLVSRPDRNVVASLSASSLQQDFPTAHVYYYAGGHGDLDQTLAPRCPAEDFLVHV